MSRTKNTSLLARLGRRTAGAVAGVAAALGLVALATGDAGAQTTTYATSKRQFRVCNLLIESSADLNRDGVISDRERLRGPENPDPHVFYIADQRADLKPQGWEFVNPLAPKFVTTGIRGRWVGRDGSAATQAAYTIGSPLRKDMGGYWEVSLRDTTIEQLLQFDLIFITNHRPNLFSPVEREKLRKVVDGGGIVWVDNCGGMRMSWRAPFFLDRVQFADGLGQGTPIVPIPDHPLLNAPYQLGYADLQVLGDKRLRSAITSTVPGDANEFASTAQAPNTETLITIVGNNQGGNVLPYVSVGNYGSGAAIINAADVGCGVNDGVGGINAGSGGNSGGVSGTNLSAADSEDLKFLYNMVAWGSSNNTFRRNNRRTGASFDSIGSALTSAWNFNNEITALFNQEAIVDSRSAPLIVGGTLVVSGVQGGNLTVRAFDLNPYNDLDGDGSFDDGRPDVSLGAPYDEVWRYNGPAANGGYPSGPSFGSVLVNRTTGARVDSVYVTAPNGVVYAIRPSRDGLGRYKADLTLGTDVTAVGDAQTIYTAMPAGVAPSPLFFENRVYVVAPNGQLRCINALNNTVRWVSFIAPPSGVTITPTGSPTMGFSRQTAEGVATARLSSGATSDLMLYAPSSVTDGAGQPTARVLPYWLGTRNEVVTATNGSNALTVPTRIAGALGNGVGQGQYFMAPGPDTDAQSPFVTPQARAYYKTTVDGVDISAQLQYQNGIIPPNPEYDVTGINIPDGTVTLAYRGGGSPNAQDVLVSVDYDVEYIRLTQNGNETPPNYDSSPTRFGARANRLLDSPSVVNSPAAFPTTPAFAPDDTLLYTLVESYRENGASAGPPVASIMGVNEQEADTSNSRLRLRFSLFNDLTEAISPANGGDGFPRLYRTVRGVEVADEAPIMNYLQFAPTYPIASTAARLRDGGGNFTREVVTGLVPVGSPVVSNNVTYFLASGNSAANGPVSVLMAFRSNPDIVLNLPEPFSLNDGVTVSQADAVNSKPTEPTQPSVVEANITSVASSWAQADPERGRIVMTSLRTLNNGMFSGSQSFVVQYTPRAGGARRTVVIAPTPRNAFESYGQATDETGQITETSGGYTPLLWYYVLPGRPTSAPTLIGDYLYYTMVRGGGSGAASFVMAVDASPDSNDPSVRIGFGEPVLNVADTFDPDGPGPQPAEVAKTNHVRPALGIPTAGELSAPPVGGRGLLAINSPSGTYAFNAGLTLVTENQRLLEVDAAASPLWSMESTLFNQVIGGELPRYETDESGGGLRLVNAAEATGRRATERKNLSKPRLAQRISASDYLIADTGNNRVVRTDRQGAILWSLSQVVDGYGLLKSGEPTSLSGPTDAQGYVVPTIGANGNQNGYEVHYLIADAGNFRIIEVADYYDAEGRAIAAPGQNIAAAGEHVVVWTSRTTSDEGRPLRYTSVQRFLGVGPFGTPYAAYNGYPYITAVVGNQTVSQNSQNTGTDTAGGSLVELNYNPYRTPTLLRDGSGAPAVVNLWPAAAMGQTARTTEPAGNGTLGSAVEEVLLVSGGQTRVKRINGPTFFRQLNLPTQGANTGRERRLFLLCDAEAAYVVEAKQAAADGKVAYVVLWYFGQREYDAMNTARFLALGTPPGTVVTLPRFQPMSIQLLGSGNFLIANGYSGRSPLFDGGQFVGEAFEVRPRGLTILSNAAYGDTRVGGDFDGFSTPRITSGTAPGQVRQVMGGGTGSGATGLVEQPTSAIRP